MTSRDTYTQLLADGVKERRRVAVPRGDEETARGRAMRARKATRIFTHDAILFGNCPKMGKEYVVLLEMSFFPKKHG